VGVGLRGASGDDLRILPQVLAPVKLLVADGPRMAVLVPVAGNHLNPSELIACVGGLGSGC